MSAVIVTRPLEQAEAVRRLLAAAGFEPLCHPTIAVEPLPDLAALDAALRHLVAYRCVVISSANAARIVCERAARLGIGQTEWRHAVVVAGPQTAAVLEVGAIAPTHVLRKFSSDAVLHALESVALEGQRVLLPGAEHGLGTIAAGLRARGAMVDEVPLYRTIPVSENAALVDDLRTRGPVAILFFSPSAVAGLVNALRAAGETLDVVQRVRVACIGHTTASAARAAGLEVALVASAPSAAALVAELRDATVPQLIGATS